MGVRADPGSLRWCLALSRQRPTQTASAAATATGATGATAATAAQRQQPAQRPAALSERAPAEAAAAIGKLTRRAATLTAYVAGNGGVGVGDINSSSSSTSKSKTTSSNTISRGSCRFTASSPLARRSAGHHVQLLAIVICAAALVGCVSADSASQAAAAAAAASSAASAAAAAAAAAAASSSSGANGNSALLPGKTGVTIAIVAIGVRTCVSRQRQNVFIGIGAIGVHKYHEIHSQFCRINWKHRTEMPCFLIRMSRKVERTTLVHVRASGICRWRKHISSR